MDIDDGWFCYMDIDDSWFCYINVDKRLVIIIYCQSVYILS